MEWCLHRLDVTAPISKQSLLLLQNPAIFYAKLGVMRSVRMDELEKAKRMVVSPDEFIFDAWVRWLTMKHNFKAPSWLTKRHLGSVKISGGEVESIVISPLPLARPESSEVEMARFE